MQCRRGTMTFYSCSAFLLLARNYVTAATSRGTTPGLKNLLVVASIVKALSGTGGMSNLDADSIPLSESLVLQVLQRKSIDVYKKLDFFNWCWSRPSYRHSTETYSQIFQTLCLHRDPPLDKILDLLTAMRRDDVLLNSSTFKLLLDTFIQSGKFDSALEILDHVEGELEMRSTSSCLNYDVYNSVLVALVHKDQLGLALSIFFKLLDASDSCASVTANAKDNNCGVFPSARACNDLLVALRKADNHADFSRVFNKLREKTTFPLDACGYNICIHAFGSWHDLPTSLGLFKEMKERIPHSGDLFEPDLCTYNSLIQVLCLSGKVKDALMVWEELKGSVHQPDAFTYRILIQGCSKAFLVDEATKIFSEMQYNGLRPDTVVYNSLINGLFKARRLTEACHMFERMIDDGIRASCWTYNILIDGLFKNGRAVAGYTLFCDLKRKGQFVDAVTYSIITLHLCREGQLDEALQIVEEMEARGFIVDLVTVSSLLIAIHKQGKWDWTERLMKHIRDGNIVPTILKWKANMEASMQKTPQSREKDFAPLFPFDGDFSELTRFLRWDNTGPQTRTGSENSEGQGKEFLPFESDQWSSSPYMDQLANEVYTNSHSILPFSLDRGKRVKSKGMDSFDIDMVNTYLSIFLAKGKLSLACKLFGIFTSMGVDPVSYTYNSMMSSFVKRGYFNEVWGVLHQMDEKICPADIATYTLVIQGLGKMGRADLATAVLDNLMKQGGYLDIVMYNSLINALGKAGRLDEANNLFDQMRASGINADVVTYNTLIEVHSKAGRLKDAYKFLKMMLDAGCPPNHVTDTTLEFLEREIEKLRYKRASIINTNKEQH